jgi:hypothetical protein
VRTAKQCCGSDRYLLYGTVTVCNFRTLFFEWDLKIRENRVCFAVYFHFHQSRIRDMVPWLLAFQIRQF